MRITQLFFKNSLRNFCYLLESESGYLICIDPFEHQLVLDNLMGKKIDMIINTHDHCDHHSGNQKLIAQFSPTVAAHKNAQIEGKNRDLLHLDVIYQEGEWELVALDTPGHTLSHVSLLLKKNGKDFGIFTGDTFFNAGVGNCYNGGDVTKLFHSIEDFYETLSDDVLVYPGHDYLKRNLEFTLSIDPNNFAAKMFLDNFTSFIKDSEFYINDMKIERSINNFLKTSNREIQKILGTNSKLETFTKLRSLRDKW